MLALELFLTANYHSTFLFIAVDEKGESTSGYKINWLIKETSHHVGTDNQLKTEHVLRNMFDIIIELNARGFLVWFN